MTDIDKFVFGPALKATAYGVEAALKTAAQAVGDLAGVDTTTTPRQSVIKSLRIWIKAFIPPAVISGPGLVPYFGWIRPLDCFLGDDRTYSSDPDASARLHSEVILNDLDTPNPTMDQRHICGTTVRVDCGSRETLETATASTDGMKFYNFRYPGGEAYNWNQPYPPAANPGTIIVPEAAPVSVDYIGGAGNPLVGPTVVMPWIVAAPLINMEAHIEFDPRTAFLSVSGAVDDYPAYEGYFLVNNQQQADHIFIHDAAAKPRNLVGGANRQFSKTVDLKSYVAQY